MMEYKSNLKLMLMSMVSRFIQFQLVVMDSRPWSRKIKSGIRLIKKDSFTAVLTWVEDQEGFRGILVVVMDEINGYNRVRKINRNDVLKISGFIASAWSCTKSFWFLRPIDNYYLSKALRKPWI